FTAGLSTPDEPDIRINSLDGRTLLWIDMGEPSVERVKKSSRQAEQLHVYSYNTKSDVWWRENKKGFECLPARYFQLSWDVVSQLAKCLQRTMEWNASISSGVLTLSTEQGDIDVALQTLN
ncbi:MAG: YaeQ family protein, partial [Sinobacterium sp.]|nr:YaeQ family protein [Sinobacterium sp.]